MSRADWLLRHSPFQVAWSLINGGRVAVLGFHGIDDPGNFASLMDLLARRHRPISIEELERAIHDGERLPKGAVLVTFDDGHRSVLEHGAPILAERGIPGVAFVIPGLLSSTQDFWWSEVAEAVARGARLEGHGGLDAAGVVRHLKKVDNDERLAAVDSLKAATVGVLPPRRQLEHGELLQLAEAGVAIGNHTWSHPCLNRCSPEAIEQEITSAHEDLQAALGTAPRWFAYPNGDWDVQAERTLVDLGYRLGFLFDHRLSGTGADPLRVSRVRVNSDTSPDRFALILSGLHPAIHHARGRP
jgi:peptidoglycan/xylan/chitin deacetylase (PgdA/CDA1 family)